MKGVEGYGVQKGTYSYDTNFSLKNMWFEKA